MPDVKMIIDTIRRICDYCTVNRQSGDSVQLEIEGDAFSDIEKSEPYGVRSNVPAGTRGFRASIGGHFNDSVFLGILSSVIDRAELNEGEVELYSKHGQVITLRENGSILLQPKEDQNVVIEGDIQINGTLNATGDIVTENDLRSNQVVANNVSDALGSLASLRGLYNAHVHPGDSGGTTGLPNNQA